MNKLYYFMKGGKPDDNRLIIFMFVCLMSLGATASAGSSETKEDDNLPPMVIETDNLIYAGAN